MWSKMSPETGAPRTLVMGNAAMNSAIAWACSRWRNQYVRYKTIPGKKPASATPSMKRAKYSWPMLVRNPVSIATAPQLINMRAIQTRAPILCSNRLLGTSNREYPRKKTPERNPNCWFVIPRSLFIIKDAKLMFVRTRKATTYNRNRNGISLIRNLGIVVSSNEGGTIKGLSLICSHLPDQDLSRAVRGYLS